jgi:hypothetical protein
MKTETRIDQPTPLEALFAAPNPADTALVPSRLDPQASVASDPLQLTQPLTPTAQPAVSRKPRNGKIARLPKPVRDVVNRMLFQNISQDRIVAALDELGININQQNISNWKTHGGYREWRLAQEYATQLRLHQDNLVDVLRRHDAPELPEVGLQAAATQLSRFFLSSAAQQLLASDPREYERRVSMLNRISAQLKALQESRDDSAKALGDDHDPDRIRCETNNSLKSLADTFTSTVGDSPKDPNIPHRNTLPNPNELLNFTDRVPDDDTAETASIREFMKALLKKSKAAKLQPPADPPANENNV